MEQSKSTNIRMLALSALFVALIAIGAFIRVPVPLWPFTLQTLFTAMAACCSARATARWRAWRIWCSGSSAADFHGRRRPQYVFQPTFGCIVGFAVGAWVAGTIVRRAKARSFRLFLLAALADMAVVYAIGMAWFWCVRTFYMHDPIGMWTLFVTCFVPTIGVDVLKAGRCGGARGAPRARAGHLPRRGGLKQGFPPMGKGRFMRPFYLVEKVLRAAACIK